MMPSVSQLLERESATVDPEPGSFERLLRRRDRKRRNQRIAAGVVGIAVFVAAVWVLGAGVGQDRTAPADRPTGNHARETAVDVARDFLYAMASYDTDQAVNRLANYANLAGLRLHGIGQFRLLLSFNEATGFQIIPTSCAETGSSSFGTYVRCTFDFNALRSEAIGRGPYSGSYLDLLVQDTPQGFGAIREVSGYLETAKADPEMWDPFKEWVSTTYPGDAAVMYRDVKPPAAAIYASHGSFRDYRLTPRSIRLWELHTSEYVKAVQQGTA